MPARLSGRRTEKPSRRQRPSALRRSVGGETKCERGPFVCLSVCRSVTSRRPRPVRRCEVQRAFEWAPAAGSRRRESKEGGRKTLFWRGPFSRSRCHKISVAAAAAAAVTCVALRRAGGRVGGEGANAAEGNKPLAFELCFRCFRLSASCITGPLSYLAAHLSLVIDIERRPSGCLDRPHGSAGEKGTQDENLILNNRLKSSACRNVATVRSCMIKGLAFPAIHASVHVFSRKTDITRERNVKKQDKPTHLPKISVETQVGKNNYEKVKR